MREKVKELLTKLPKTLRTILSYCNSFYDLTGFIMPLHNQLRVVTIDLMINGRGYDDILDNDSCLIELIKSNSYKYKRRSNEEDLEEDGKKLIITYSDYSMAWVNLTYQLEEKKDNTFAITLLQARAGILHNTIPKGELIALTKASQLHNEVIKSVPIKISDDFILTDSKTAIYWKFRMINQDQPVVERESRMRLS